MTRTQKSRSATFKIHITTPFHSSLCTIAQRSEHRLQFKAPDSRWRIHIPAARQQPVPAFRRHGTIGWVCSGTWQQTQCARCFGNKATIVAPAAAQYQQLFHDWCRQIYPCALDQKQEASVCAKLRSTAMLCGSVRNRARRSERGAARPYMLHNLSLLALLARLDLAALKDLLISWTWALYRAVARAVQPTPIRTAWINVRLGDSATFARQLKCSWS